MPTSEKQIAANRRNAQKTTGPTHPAGKTLFPQNEPISDDHSPT